MTWKVKFTYNIFIIYNLFIYLGLCSDFGKHRHHEGKQEPSRISTKSYAIFNQVDSFSKLSPHFKSCDRPGNRPV